MLDERLAGRPVSNEDLQLKARDIAQGIPGMEDFKGSDGWLVRWKKRNAVGIRRGTNESQKLPADFQVQVTAFKRSVDAYRDQNDVSLVRIGNMDQTMCRFDMAPRTTNNRKGARDIRIATTGGSKKGYTVALAACADGTKLPAFIVFKEAGARIPPRVLNQLYVPRNVKITASKNGWMTSDIMKEWIQRIWRDEVDGERRMLVLDQARIHTCAATRANIENAHTDVFYIPAGCTSICQPADVSWNAPFKKSMRKQWSEYRRQDQRTAAGNLKMATRQDAIDWVSRAWFDVSEDTIRHSFKACGLSLLLDGSENGLLTDRMAAALTGMMADQGAGQLQMLFESDSDSGSEFSGFSADESDDEN